MQYNFAEPDDFLSGANQTLTTSPIWRYGNIELHFNEDLLHFIFSDYVEKLDGGSNLHLDKWILESRSNTRMEDWVAVLNRNVKNFKVVQKPELEQSMLILEQGDGAIVKLSFTTPNPFSEASEKKNPSEYILGAICLCSKELASF